MEPSLQRRVQRYGWDKASGYYEAYWQKQLFPAQQKLLQLANIKDGDKIIDIACGTGLVSFPAAELAGERRDRYLLMIFQIKWWRQERVLQKKETFPI